MSDASIDPADAPTSQPPLGWPTDDASDAPDPGAADAGSNDLTNSSSEADALFSPPQNLPMAVGRRCATGNDCQSGSCVDGVCCAAACTAPCHACNIPGYEGTCLPVPAGQDPAAECEQDAPASCGRDGLCDGAGNCRRYPVGTLCAPGTCVAALEHAARACDGNGVCQAGTSRSCAPNNCAGSSCATVCAADGDCQAGFMCENGSCRSKRSVGAICATANQCATGYCTSGVCCSTPCTEACYSCNVANAVGTCTPVADGTDPANHCPAEAAATCGRSGGCNGRGACRLHAADVVCAAQSCAGAKELPASTCNGSGVCVAAAPLDCNAGFSCVAGRCQKTAPPPPPPPPPVAPPALHWRLDEATGTVAMDSSANALHGTYTGTTGIPVASPLVPMVMFPDPSSRAFTLANRHAIHLPTMPAALKPANSLTVSAWFRATQIDTSGAELVSGGNQYLLRVGSDTLRFSRRLAGGTISVQCDAMSTGHLDDKWHHLAGVQSPAGMKLYLDGAERCTNTRGEDIRYDGEPGLWVGRHPTNALYDFGGNVDDVRVYTRALTADEIRALFQGAN